MAVPAVVETTVRTLTRDKAEIRWELIEDVGEPIENFQFVAQRSEGPEGEWKTIDTIPSSLSMFIDEGANFFSKYRTLLYRILVQRISDPTVDFFAGEPATIDDPPDLFLLRIRWLEARILLRRFVGSWCGLFIKRTFGQRCICWDNKLMKVANPNCTDCFLSGFVGGFEGQVNTFVNVRPTPQVVRILPLGEWHPSETDSWMSAAPLVKPGDLVVELRTNKRWRISAVHTTEHRRAVSRQILNLTELDKSNIEYKIPIVKSERPTEAFVGFYPAGTPGIYLESPKEPEGSALL